MTTVSKTVGIVGSTTRATLWLALGALTLGAAVATRHSFAQPATATATEPVPPPPAALQDLVGPIALYPDDLVAIVLPASTYPLQVVEAARFLDKRATDATLQPKEEWDDSVVALLNYPDVVKLMNDDLDWTWKLGDAVINQRAAVLDAIQGFRDRAYAAGNLRSDDRQVVQNDAGAIAIKPANPEVIYVPYYEPERVVVYQSAPAYHYYPWAYPVYYYPYPVGYAFNTGFFWGVTSAFVIGWHSHYVQVCPHNYYGHPYYGHSYHDAFYVRGSGNVSASRGGYVWEPHYRSGAQPFTRSDGRQFVGTRDGGGMHGSYRTGSGGTSRSSGQQPSDPRAADTRSTTTPGTSPRANGGRASYRSPDPSGGLRGAAQRNGVATPLERARGTTGSVPSTSPADATPRSRDAGGSNRAAPGASTEQAARQAAPTTSGSAATRVPGQYRSGGGLSEAFRESQARGAAHARPDLNRADGSGTTSALREGQYRTGGTAQRYTLPQPRQQSMPAARTERPAVERSGSSGPRGGIGGAYAAAPQRAQRSEANASRGSDSGGSAPSYRGGSDGGRSSGHSGRGSQR